MLRSENFLPSGPDRPPDRLDLTLGIIRLGVGAGLMLAPRRAGRIWVGPGADGPASLVFARALGARDVALGAQVVRGVRQGEPVRHWVAAGFVADAADAVATLLAAPHLTKGRRVAMPAIAAAVGLAGLASWRRSPSTSTDALEEWMR